jgi:deoxyribodipyrimidine photolyase-related protein
VKNVEEIKAMSKEANLIFPHQLFADSPLLQNGMPIYLIEEFLFFRQYNFHKQKIAFHRASMKSYEAYLKNKGHKVIYIASNNPQSDLRLFIEENKTLETINIVDPTDNWLEKRLERFSITGKLTLYPSPLFLNSKEDNATFFREDKKFFFQTTFYKQQRKRYGILVNEDRTPFGGKWSFDSENRKKYPKNKEAPEVSFPEESAFWTEAIDYVHKYFYDNHGSLEEQRYYPIDHKEAEIWLEQFLKFRFYEFGTYEDAIVEKEGILNHSLLSPLLNVGLLTPTFILQAALSYTRKNEIPLNSTEGFVRQIIGWREFIRGMYELKGSHSRTYNYWKFSRKIPSSFYTGETGIRPVDEVIKRVLKTGYCHHIERLMILGNFMILCEFDPDEVYRWFMELFIDAYDWVMVPNVYGMSQFADGGSFATKPYISGSNYLKKMSNFPNGEWQEIWDGLFWRFINLRRDTFSKNPRMSMLLKILEHMSVEKRESHFERAEKFLATL